MRDLLPGGGFRRPTYHRHMLESPRAVPLEEIAAAAEVTELRCVRMPDPGATIRGVVVHAPDDPVPRPDLLVLCTAPEKGIPECPAVVLRESSLIEDGDGVVPPDCAVFVVAGDVRWSDVYDRVQWAVGESFGRLAERDVFHLADALATALGGAVSIEDARRRVVAFSTVAGQPIDDVRRRGILGRQVPEHVERGQWYGRLWRASGVVEFRAGPESSSRLALAVRVGGEPIGSIWVMGGRDSLCGDAEAILLRSVETVAACLAHQDHFASRGRDYRRQTLRELFDGAAGDASGTDRELAAPVLLVAVRRRQADDAELLDERLADVLSLRAERLHGAALTAALDGHVYAVVACCDRVRLDAMLRPILSRDDAEALVAVSSKITEFSQLTAARSEVDRTLRMHANDTAASEQWVHYVDDDRDRLLLAEIAEALHGVAGLQSGVVATMAEHDREHGTDYVTTLRAWLESGGDAPAASARLFVHPNTFRYRMSRLRSLFELDLDHPDLRLLLHLQARIRDFG
jgi:hypothetical protein